MIDSSQQSCAFRLPTTAICAYERARRKRPERRPRRGGAVKRERHECLAEAIVAEAIYSVGTLARLGNISADRMRRVLRSNGVKMMRVGRVLAVSLADVKKKIPPLWDSMLVIERLRQAIESGEGVPSRETRVRASRAREP